MWRLTKGEEEDPMTPRSVWKVLMKDTVLVEVGNWYERIWPFELSGVNAILAAYRRAWEGNPERTALMRTLKVAVLWWARYVKIAWVQSNPEIVRGLCRFFGIGERNVLGGRHGHWRPR